jgi:hypothetical protein
MTSIYHAGELAVQARAGVQAEAERLMRGIGTSITPAAQDFLRSQRLAIASTVGTSNRVWASLLTGEPGFVQTISDQIVRINAVPITGDPLRENLLQDDIGVLVIDLATRRRLRLNGKAEIQADGCIYVYTKQVYFNCPKYIQIRHLNADSSKLQASPQIQNTKVLTYEQQQWITRTDTFFIASFHPGSGADASHRGGYPGFVRILNANQLVFPEYAGNNMFNTLGNISIHPQTGLLFVDFESGSTLQLTGKAKIIWQPERVAEFVGAERLVEFQIHQILEITNAIPLRWQFGEYSPFNPA